MRAPKPAATRKARVRRERRVTAWLWLADARIVACTIDADKARSWLDYAPEGGYVVPCTITYREPAAPDTTARKNRR